MKKFLIVVMVLALALTGCGKTKRIIYENDEKTFFDTFIVLEQRDNFDDGYLYIVYDKETKVEYYIFGSGYRGGICPIYNTDGTVKVYKENKENE